MVKRLTRMTIVHVLILLSLPLLLVAAALAAATETALFSLNYADRVKLMKLAPRAADAAAALLTHPRELLVSLLFLNMIVSTVYFVLTSLLVLDATRMGMEWLGVLVSVVNLVLMTVVAEVVSKMLAARRRVEFTRLLARPTWLLIRGMGPLRVFLDRGVVAPLARLLVPGGGGGGEVGKSVTGEVSTGELAALVACGTRDGTIDHDEQRVLWQVIHFGSLRVRDVMTPRVELEWVSERAKVEEVIEIARRTGLTRLPVARGSLDGEVTGLLNVKTYLAAHARGMMARTADHLEPVRFVPDSAALDRLLEMAMARGVKQALCVDEHGAIVGLVATRNIVGRLIAELGADAGSEGALPEVQMIGLGRWLVSGRLPAREWAEMFGLTHDARMTTVAGLVLARLGRLPNVGDKLNLGNVSLRVHSLTGRMVDLLEVSLVERRGAGEGPVEDRRGPGRAL